MPKKAEKKPRRTLSVTYVYLENTPPAVQRERMRRIAELVIQAATPPQRLN